jgi:hypothetical protein
MAKFKALARGTQLVLVAGPLLLLSLFFTWQNEPVDYGRSGIATVPLDGFDAWGLLIALMTLATVVIVVLDEFSGVELSEDVPWATVTFVLGVAVFATAVVKSLTDTGSTWESYAFVGLAGAIAIGTYLDWATLRRAARQPVLGRKRRGISSAA